MVLQPIPSIEEIKEKVVPILKRHGATRAGIFGSYARGEMREDSDVDILVELPRDRISFLDFIGIIHELEDELGRKVDLGEYHTIKPFVRQRILAEEIRILR